MWCAYSPETTRPELNSSAWQGEEHLWWTQAIVSNTGNIINGRSRTAHIWQAVFHISLEPIHLRSNANNLTQISSSWWHEEGICYWKIMINAYYHHLSYPSVSTFWISWRKHLKHLLNLLGLWSWRARLHILPWTDVNEDNWRCY